MHTDTEPLADENITAIPSNTEPLADENITAIPSNTEPLAEEYITAIPSNTEHLAEEVGSQSSSMKRSHALLSPMNSPEQGLPPAPKRKPRTGTEFRQEKNTEVTHSYNFHEMSTTCLNSGRLSITDFRLSNGENISVNTFLNQVTSFYLVKGELPSDIGSLQTFFATCTNAPQPEVGNVKYIQVLDEVADRKDTMLHVISDLYAEYICKNGNQFLVLEGDAKTYDLIQAIKHEYGSDLNWLIPVPGDWHLLKNYQLCLMKPFFDAGLKSLAVASGYPPPSVQSCSNFKRTHHFLIETWESLFRHMLSAYKSQHETTAMTQKLESAVEELKKHQKNKTANFCTFHSLQEELDEINFLSDFQKYINNMSELDDTWKFWKRFVFEDCLPYIGLFMAIRSENWHLRMASLKSMAADFTAFDHPIYQKLIAHHVVDVFHMPQVLVDYLQDGGFAFSISGRALHSVGLDECHEMLINKHVKQAVVRPTEDYISRIAKYIPTRIKCIEHLKTQLLIAPSDTDKNTHLFCPGPSDVKSEANIRSEIQKIEEIKLLPETISSNRGLVNPFTSSTANEVQRHDLMNFHQVGVENYETSIKAYILKTPSVKVPRQRKRLQTFSTTQKKKQKKVVSLQQEMKRIQKCIRRKIAYANKMGTTADVIGEQYIELPMAICDPKGSPIIGQKSIATHFYEARYTEANLITHSFPDNYIPDTAILEGMFLIHTKPLNIHKTMSDYATFLMTRFLSPYFSKGTREVHLLFDRPDGQEENPKIFEQQRRDDYVPDHTCVVLSAGAAVPKKWQQLLKCRKCKRAITTFLSTYISDNVSTLLQENQKFVTSGACDSCGGIEVTTNGGKVPSAVFENITDESDTRIWLHAKHSIGGKIFVLSPDTDVYHIGLPLVSQTCQVLVQLSRPSDKELKLLDLNLLLDLFKRDPDLANIPETDIPYLMQALQQVATTSLFYRHRKVIPLQSFLSKCYLYSWQSTWELFQ